MPRQKVPNLAEWFSNCGSWGDHHDLKVLKAGLAAGYLDEQDESGMTALSLAVMSQWMDGTKISGFIFLRLYVLFVAILFPAHHAALR